MALRTGFVVAILLFSILSGIVVNIRTTTATQNEQGKHAIIIVASPYGTDIVELEKSRAFHQYLMDEGYTEENISYLAFGKSSGIDSEANVSNVENAFLDLTGDTEKDREIVIYLSDHGHMIDNESFLCFSDGNISYSFLRNCIRNMSYFDLKYISGGNRSGLAGPELSGPERTIICSMSSNQSFHHDQFNITRGLEDPSSDINGDGDVSYHEAYLKERYNLRFNDQDPQYYCE